MKKLLLYFICCILATQAFSQADSTLDEYTGKYSFAAGGPVSAVNITIDKGTLIASSDAGSSELRKTNVKDEFDIVSYQGTAVFKRNADGKIIGLQLIIGETVMDGSKDGLQAQIAASYMDLLSGNEKFSLKYVPGTLKPC